MILFKHSKDLRSHLKKIRENDLSIGFVPTMGALHPGHISLIEKSKAETDITVCSIYVNPVQFNNKEDFKNYPVTIEADVLMLEKAGCDILFLPGDQEIYPNENAKNKHFDIGFLETILEGKYRPGHFQGVCVVVEKLLSIVEPTHLFLGQKDFQQSLVIKNLVSQMHNGPEIIIAPTLRESSGLAMSSRNQRLTDEEKQNAADLHKTLMQIKKKLAPGKVPALKKKSILSLEKLGFKIDYLELASTENLEIFEDFTPGKSFIILIAAFLNKVRLIDNVIVTA